VLIHIKFDEGNVGTDGLGNHEQPILMPDLALSSFYIFIWVVKVHIAGQKFQTKDKHEVDVLNWLYS
jgi:hypothetical protein